MMKALLITASTLAILFGSLGYSLQVRAQEVPDGSLNQPDTTDPFAGFFDTGDGTFDWRWLLPLLAIPVLFWLARRETEEDRGGREQYSVGVKGGQAGSDHDESDVDTDESRSRRSNRKNR